MDIFQVSDNTLYVSGDLDLTVEEAFKSAMENLLQQSGDTLVLDMSSTGFVGSSFFGQVFYLNYRIKKENRNLKLIAPSKMMTVLDLLGLPQLMEVEIVN